MKIGAVSNANRPLEKQLQEADDVGLDFVEVVVDGPNSGLNFLLENADKIKEVMEMNSLDLFLHLPWQLGLGSPYEDCRKDTLKTLAEILKVGEKLNAKKAIVHPSSVVKKYWGEEEIKENIIRSLRSLNEVADKYGVELLAENAGDYFEPKNFEEIFEETDLNMCFDTGHAKVTGFDEEEMIDFIKKNRKRISHFHLNDNRGDEDLHLSLGYGFIDFKKILKALKGMGWNGSLSIELYTEDSDYLRISKEKLENWLEM